MSQHRQDNSREPYPRIGWVSEVHSDQTRVKVDFHGNTVGQPVWAAIGRAFTKSDIELAIDNQLDCRIDFLAGDLSLPILVDIYSSLLDEELLVLRAKNMVIQGDESIILRSGEAQVSMTAKNGTIKTTAQHINTSADKLHKIQATKVRLN
ncbi:hypothetical protein [Vibrio japonicus]|uniref:Uncharacterized protein n=1 Tax=Vibrio japonicus TaxID=1824638 RepID=A0ABY5LIE3_9VIBR|nr:hypothetical protein [Vibrio japonicus]UUM31576.1 hypothetical protein NP165_05440 [Vibrio japonicus]